MRSICMPRYHISRSPGTWEGFVEAPPGTTAGCVAALSEEVVCEARSGGVGEPLLTEAVTVDGEVFPVGCTLERLAQIIRDCGDEAKLGGRYPGVIPFQAIALDQKERQS